MKHYISFSMRLALATLLVITSLALAPVVPARAATMTVNSLADTTTNDGFCTLREAITNANADAATWVDCPSGTGADVISFNASGTIILTSNLPQITDTDGLTINGGSNITISGNSLYRIFDLATNPQTFSVLNITLRNATASSGPALRTRVTSPITLTNVTFNNNTATTLNGGAIYFNSAALLTVTDSTFTENTASNAAGDGGAIYVDLVGASLNISGSTFTGNNAGDDAGAVAVGVAGQTVTITNTTFRNNTAGSASTDGVEGGALRNFGTTTITLSSFVGNQITTANDINVRGGAVANNGGILTVANSTFSGNSVMKNNVGATGASQGGAIYTTAGAMINSVTFSGNTTSQTGTGNNNGGNVYRLGGVVNLTSTIVNAGTPNNCSGTITDGGYNIDSAATCGFTQPTSLSNTSPNLGTLTGTPDYFLLNTGSLAINGGPATCAATPINGQSQNGLSRPQGAACDIGSYEALADITPPTVTMSSVASNPTSTSPIAVTAQFSETVTGFVLGDIVPGNGTVSNFVAVDGDTYTFDLTPSSSGLVTADIAVSVAVDAALNGNLAAIQFSRTYDNTQPTVTLSSAASNPTNVSPIAVTVQFSETVTGFVAGDIVPGNGTVGNFVAVDGDTYTFDLIPISSGLVTADVAAGVATNSLGIGNTVATQFSRTYDNSQPTVTMSSAASDPTGTSPIAVTVQFSETVTGFVSGDIVPSNGIVSNFVAVDGDTYTFDLTPSSSGLVTADIAVSVAVDAALNGNLAAAQFSRTYDNNLPVVVSILRANPSPTTASSVAFTVNLSKNVTGVSASNFTVAMTGTATGTIFNVTGSNSTYTVVLNLGTGTGTVGLNMTNSTGVTDGVGNPVSGLPFVGQVYVVDFTSPLVTSNGINTVGDTGDGHLDELEIVIVGVSQLLVRFNEDLYNPSGDTGADDVTNPANFILVHDTGSGIHTTACNLGVIGGDSQMTVTSVDYANGGGSGPFLATLNLNNGDILPNGVYRLLVCGSTSLTDLVGNELAGDGTNSGTDFARNFVVAVTNTSGGSTTNTSNANVKASALPDTGFAPNLVSWLPAQPAEKMYAVYSDLILEIPSLNLKASIIGVPNLQDGWDVTWLGKQAGYLQGSAFPTTIGNSILTGHVWNANNNPGIFFGLKDLRYGDKVLIHAWGKVYTYETQSQSRVLPSAVKAILKQENQSWITLLTCDSYNEKSGKYAYRRVVRAVLVSVTEDK